MPVEIRCARCGVLFPVKPHLAATTRFCSRACYGNAPLTRGHDLPAPVDGAAWIELGAGRFTIVDADDYAAAALFTWYRDSCGYAATKDGARTVLLHRLVMGEPALIVDHVSRDKLDNRKANLRLANRSQNLANGRKFRGLSDYRGVHWHKHRGKWYARIAVDGRQINIGSFDDQEAAARAYDDAARRLHGEFASLNFPRDGERAARAER